jgi:hypothetical protein
LQFENFCKIGEARRPHRRPQHQHQPLPLAGQPFGNAARVLDRPQFGIVAQDRVEPPDEGETGLTPRKAGNLAQVDRLPFGRQIVDRRPELCLLGRDLTPQLARPRGRHPVMRGDRCQRLTVQNLAVGVSGFTQPQDRILKVAAGPHRIEHFRELVLDDVERFLLVRQHQHIAAGQDRLEDNGDNRVALAAPGRSLDREKPALLLAQCRQNLALLLVERHRRREHQPAVDRRLAPLLLHRFLQARRVFRQKRQHDLAEIQRDRFARPQQAHQLFVVVEHCLVGLVESAEMKPIRDDDLAALRLLRMRFRKIERRHRQVGGPAVEQALHHAGEILPRLQIDNALVDPDAVWRGGFPRDLLRREIDRLLVDVEVRVGRDAENPLLELDADRKIKQRIGRPVEAQFADVQIRLEILPNFQRRAELVQFLKKVRGREAVEIAFDLAPDRLRIRQVTKHPVQFLERILHQSRRQTRPDRLPARLDQTLPQLLLDVVHRLEGVTAGARQRPFELRHQRRHDRTDHVAFDSSRDRLRVAIGIVLQLRLKLARRHRSPVGNRAQILFAQRLCVPVDQLLQRRFQPTPVASARHGQREGRVIPIGFLNSRQTSLLRSGYFATSIPVRLPVGSFSVMLRLGAACRLKSVSRKSRK